MPPKTIGKVCPYVRHLILQRAEDIDHFSGILSPSHLAHSLTRHALLAEGSALVILSVCCLGLFQNRVKWCNWSQTPCRNKSPVRFCLDKAVRKGCGGLLSLLLLFFTKSSLQTDTSEDHNFCTLFTVGKISLPRIARQGISVLFFLTHSSCAIF